MKAKEKKRLITSYQNLPQEARDLFDTQYGEGYADAAQKITKPDGSTLYVVPLESEDAIYMVKVDVVIDSKFSDEDFDKEILGSPKDDDEVVEATETEDEDGLHSKDKFVLVHGDYSEIENIEDERDEADEE